MLMVCLAELLNFLDASCWRVLVVKGGLGFEVRGFFFISVTIQSPDLSSFTNSSDCDSVKRRTFSFFNSPVLESKSLLLATFNPSTFTKVALKFSLPFPFVKSAFKSK